MGAAPTTGRPEMAVQGDPDAVDDFCDPAGAVAVRVGHLLHARRLHPYPPRHCGGGDCDSSSPRSSTTPLSRQGPWRVTGSVALPRHPLLLRLFPRAPPLPALCAFEGEIATAAATHIGAFWVNRRSCCHVTMGQCAGKVSRVWSGAAQPSPPLHRLALTSRTQTWVTPSAPLWLPRAASACPPRPSTVRPG